MADVKWIKISTDIFDNRKIKQIEHMPEGDALIVIWFKLLILAGDTNDGGQVYLTQEIPYTEPLLANQFNRPIQLIQLALHTFEQFNMIEIVDDIIHISNWEKYQNVEGMERCREKTRLRVQKFRAKKKLEETKLLEDVTLHETLQETLPKRSVTHLEEEGEREKEEDKKYISPSSEVEPPTEKASASILTKTQQSRFDEEDERFAVIKADARSAFEWFRTAARHDPTYVEELSAKGKYLYAKCFIDGLGTEFDREKGTRLMLVAGKGGSSEAVAFLKENGVTPEMIYALSKGNKQ